jgi:metal-responsive CopG/Arc/MetJ family transcriptional regulator
MLIPTEAYVSTAKVAISLDKELLERIDRLVTEKKFPSRSRVIQHAIEAQIDRLDRRRLADECAKLDRAYEQQLAELGISYDLESWPGF